MPVSPLPRRPLALAVFAALALAGVGSAAENETVRQYLSGHGPNDAVPWEFESTGGRRAGEHTTIPVPSNWELQGFGTYNYGEEPTPKSDEHGLYKVHFKVPAAWKGRRIRLVFDGAMTDTTVKVNGQSAGPTHQGAFYRFRYDVTSLVKLGEDNFLEADVAKVSASPDTEAAERLADYWVFGGIFRPVFLEALPAQWIDHTAIDAGADGVFKADVALGEWRDADHIEAEVTTLDGKTFGTPFKSEISAGSKDRVQLQAKFASPALWTAEKPQLYLLHLSLRRGNEVLHSVVERFGFRTFEVRAGQGYFLNGNRVLLKGVDRHSFRPETGRALTRENCYEDVRLIKEMNMNAVRMSHYPPDVEFLEACDELGLYVLDELSGWHHAHTTEVGKNLVREMVERDVNHPSILFWDNGNEGGWNRALDGEFSLYDPQHRHVLHPWEVLDGVDTHHYPSYNDLTKRLKGPNILMPTEFLHALYDGGAGAGLDDYWRAISSSPYGGGGFIWVLADEGIKRTDQNGRIDVFSTFDADGIVGPHHEKEGSFYTVREVWSPVQIDRPTLDEHFDGALTVHNRYAFNSLADCQFNWKLLEFRKPDSSSKKAKVVAQGKVLSPAVEAGKDGTLAFALPSGWAKSGADALAVTAVAPDGKELWTWTWATVALDRKSEAAAVSKTPASKRIQQTDTEVVLQAGKLSVRLDAKTGLLREVARGGKPFALTNGPRLAFARPESVGTVSWLPFEKDDLTQETHTFSSPQWANTAQIELDYARKLAWGGFKLELTADGKTWKTIFDASRRPSDGKRYEFPPQLVSAVRISHILGTDGQPLKLKTLRVGYDAARFPATTPATSTVTTGEKNGASGAEAWLESRSENGLMRFRWTLHEDGALQLDYAYALSGEVEYHGITFDHPEQAMTSLRWLGEGPYHVWQNRLQGTVLGIHEIAQHDLQPGESWAYPEFQGYFAGLRWAELKTSAGEVLVQSSSPKVYLRVGTPRISHNNTTGAFPAGDLSFMQAIAPMGSKFIKPEDSGPSAAWAKADGEYNGTLTFRFGE